MLRSEKRSLIRFLIIYLGSTFILFSIASWLYYISSKHHLLDQQRESIKYEAEHIKSQLKKQKSYADIIADDSILKVAKDRGDFYKLNLKLPIKK